LRANKILKQSLQIMNTQEGIFIRQKVQGASDQIRRKCLFKLHSVSQEKQDDILLSIIIFAFAKY